MLLTQLPVPVCAEHSTQPTYYKDDYADEGPYPHHSQYHEVSLLHAPARVVAWVYDVAPSWGMAKAPGFK